MTHFGKALATALLCMTFQTCSSDSGTNPSRGAVTFAKFSSIQQTVFTPTCALSNCHNGTQRPHLSAGIAYSSIVNVPSTQGLDYIEPGNPDNSYLFRKIIGVGIVGLQMPRTGPPLSAAVQDSIRLWIQNGAPNN